MEAEGGGGVSSPLLPSFNKAVSPQSAFDV